MEKVNMNFKGIDKGDRYIEQMKEIAEKRNVELTENAPKIAKARAMTDCPLDKCICDRDDPERGCISDKCMKEIQEEGQCHCRAFRKK